MPTLILFIFLLALAVVQGALSVEVAMADGVPSHVRIVPAEIYCQDRPAGVSYQYYPEGAVYQKGYCQDGKKEGLFIQYYENGNIWKEEQYHQGQLHGGVGVYYAEGAVYRELYYEHGKPDGPQRVYGPGGQLMEEKNYADGRVVAVRTPLLEKEEPVETFSSGKEAEGAIPGRSEEVRPSSGRAFLMTKDSVDESTGEAAGYKPYDPFSVGQ